MLIIIKEARKRRNRT